MNEYIPGRLVRSLAGHDKDQYFIVLAEEGAYVALADGKGRTLAKPKKKKKKHLQLAGGPLPAAEWASDEKIRIAIRNCMKSSRSI